MNNVTSADLALDDRFIQWVKNPTQENNKHWENWLAQNPDGEETLLEARELVILLSQDEVNEKDYELDEVWLRLTEARKQAPGPPSGGGRIIPLQFWRNRSLMAAAAVGLILLVSAIAVFWPQNEKSVQYATTFGEKRTIQLPDNSVIVLNSNSIVTIPEKWDTDKPRRVTLEGEAFFSVTHQANNQKFIVSTPGGKQIDVLGTEFNVYDRDNESRIVLASGKVNLSLQQNGKIKQVEMQPGDLVSVTADAAFSLKRVDPSLYTAWMEDKIYFDDYTLKDVAHMLEQQYGYKVVFDSKALSDQKITAFLEVKSPEDILSTISETFEVTITQKDKTITIGSL
jgi:transmembrane sensor